MVEPVLTFEPSTNQYEKVSYGSNGNSLAHYLGTTAQWTTIRGRARALSDGEWGGDEYYGVDEREHFHVNERDDL